jgi:CheY-like chemotaxis protein
MAGSSPDVTDRMLAEEALRESDRRKTEFLGVLSHELRNPLAPIRNSVHVLRAAPPGSPPALRATAVIERQTDHLVRMVDDLLDVTRVERGKIVIERRPLDLREVVRRTCEDHGGLFEARGVALRVEAGGPAWVDADATRLAQVLGNLLQNAAKFTPSGGVVQVAVAAAGDRAELRVRDDGAGIAPDLLPRLFTPFVQAEGGMARTKGGLGLGLALVKGIVELHGGAVRVSSRGPGAGAEFVVSLPLAPAPPRADPPTPPEPSPPPQAFVILVIDDNADAAEAVAEALRLAGFRVHVASDGRSGLEKARALRPQAVVCDLGLPDLDGYELARTLRREHALDEARLIALSGYARPEDLERAKQAGFDVHLAKPASVEQLLASLAG